jgi:hypothetical protein
LIELKKIEHAKITEDCDSPELPIPPTRVEKPNEECFDRDTALAILSCKDRHKVIALRAEMKKISEGEHEI